MARPSSRPKAGPKPARKAVRRGGDLPPPPIPLEEAERILFARVPPPVAERVPLGRAAGRVLAEEAAADEDQPPFDRAMMDGYAVHSADVAKPPVELEVVEDIPAGHVPTRKVGRGECARIMTGAALPPGPDAVQQVEKTDGGGRRVRILAPVTAGQNVAPRGSDVRAREVVLTAPRLLRPQDLAVLASVGKTEVATWRRPRCAVIATGDELVDPSERPGPGQIRNSNGVGLPEQVRRLGLECDVLPRAPDRLEDLRARIREGLSRDVLILSGGVSAGDRDLVVPALKAEGVDAAVHQVLIRPGRPVFFGTKGRVVVFGLPGNPVSAFVTFEVLVRPFLGRMMGYAGLGGRRVRARLAAPLAKRMERTVFWPAMLEMTGDGPVARTLPWKSSADLATLARADALAIQPRERVLDEGAWVDVVLLD
jgi:molybdopterin molybdotransferase